MKLNMNSLSGDRFLNMFYGGLTELGALLLFSVVVERRGRQQSYMGFMAAAAVSMVMASFASARKFELSPCHFLF